MLSLIYEIDGEYKGKSEEAPLEIATLVKAKQYEFDDAEVNSVFDYVKKVLTIPQTVLLKVTIRWLF